MRVFIYFIALAVVTLGFYVYYKKSNPFGKKDYKSFIDSRFK